MHIIFQTLTNAVKLTQKKLTNVIRMLLVLILRAHTTALVIPHSLGMVWNAKVCLFSQKPINGLVLIVKVRLFCAMPFFFLGLGLVRLLIHFSHIFKSVIIMYIMLAVSFIHDFANTTCKWMLWLANPVPCVSGRWRVKMLLKLQVF